MKDCTNSQNWLTFKRHVRFGDCDSAGVIHFHHLFRWSHEAWEESLENFGLFLPNIFPGVQTTENPKVALPIINCCADYLKPISIGQILEVKIQPEKVDSTSFQILFRFNNRENLVATSLIRHVSINIKTQKRCELPKDIQFWLEHSLKAVEN